MNIKKYLKYLDPYNYLELFLQKTIGKDNTKFKKSIYFLSYIIFSFILAFLIYQLISLILGVNMPLAIVVSRSMEPNLKIGDLVILTKAKDLDVKEIDLNYNISKKDLKDFADLNYKTNQYGLKQIDSIKINTEIIYIEDTKNNDIVVYNSNIRNKNIIHRAILLINAKDGKFIITKGDNNKTNTLLDQDCNIRQVNNKLILQNNCLHLYPTPINSVKGKLIGRIPYIGYIKIIFSKIFSIF
jgi:signal peptidase I